MSWWKFWEGGEPERPREDATDYYDEGVDLVRQERYHEALTSFRLALRERPDEAAPLEQMGVVYTRIGMTDEAIKAYRRALERDPESAAAHYGIGFLLLNRGREGEAADHLNRFLETAPAQAEQKHLRHARETLDELEAAAEPAGEGDAAGEDVDE
jgi:Flp pilus assembly protein TadD